VAYKVHIYTHVCVYMCVYKCTVFIYKKGPNFFNTWAIRHIYDIHVAHVSTQRSLRGFAPLKDTHVRHTYKAYI